MVSPTTTNGVDTKKQEADGTAKTVSISSSLTSQSLPPVKNPMTSNNGDNTRRRRPLPGSLAPVLGNEIAIPVNLNHNAIGAGPQQQQPHAYIPAEDVHRAVHIIRLAAIRHNFLQVESAAVQQRCSVITVVKADGYGHGALCTALHLADSCGADAFAVATLEEGIALRQALERNPAGSKNLATLFGQNQQQVLPAQQQKQQQNGGSPVGDYVNGSSGGGSAPPRPTFHHQRPPHVRILVLGPPVGFPNCFNDYYHYNIEAMISGPEVAAALAAWVANERDRKQTQVERAAREAQELALLTVAPMTTLLLNNNNAKPSAENNNNNNNSTKIPPPATESAPAALETPRKALPHPSSTLGNVSGQDLAREVRTLLMNQKAATEQQEHAAAQQATTTTPSVSIATSRAPSRATSSDNSLDSDSAAGAPETTITTTPIKKAPLLQQQQQPVPQKQIFGGIEVVAKNSRVRQQQALMKATKKNGNDSSSPSSPLASASSAAVPNTNGVAGTPRKRLRWHALVDSGMGRLGFKTEPVAENDTTGRRDTVDIIQELVHAEIHDSAPIEFYGMCTHMADASNSTSTTYTHNQISKFIALLQRVRDAGISIPTVSTDNSAALLTTNLTHFDADLILSQPYANTRGYVRCGGAIYGQRPAFTELRAVSTLIASVRHVAVLQQGESVGYDRAYVAPYDVRIATLTIGFADGYPRDLGNGVGKVAIRGCVFPVAGNVCMDMLMVELGPADDDNDDGGVGATVVLGDTAVLWGPIEDDRDEGLVRLQDIASTLKTTQSALTCGLNKTRVSRLYI